MCRKPSRTFVLCKMNELSNTSMSGECGGGGGGEEVMTKLSNCEFCVIPY